MVSRDLCFSNVARRARSISLKRTYLYDLRGIPLSPSSNPEEGIHLDRTIWLPPNSFKEVKLERALLRVYFKRKPNKISTSIYGGDLEALYFPFGATKDQRDEGRLGPKDAVNDESKAATKTFLVETAQDLLEHVQFLGTQKGEDESTDNTATINFSKKLAQKALKECVFEGDQKTSDQLQSTLSEIATYGEKGATKKNQSAGSSGKKTITISE